MGVKSLVQGLNAAATAGFEPRTVWSEVRRRNRLATAKVVVEARPVCTLLVPKPASWCRLVCLLIGDAKQSRAVIRQWGLCELRKPYQMLKKVTDAMVTKSCQPTCNFLFSQKLSPGLVFVSFCCAAIFLGTWPAISYFEVSRRPGNLPTSHPDVTEDCIQIKKKKFQCFIKSKKDIQCFRPGSNRGPFAC